jgi:hypothetical protein
MSDALLIPNAESVVEACKRFERDNEVVESTLKELFHLFPENSDLRHVLLKVVAVNSLYCCNILEVSELARHIQTNSEWIDSELKKGSPEVVDKIAKVSVQGKPRNFYSFATKYCNWHQPALYPIYCAKTDTYLRCVQQHDHFAAFQQNDLRNYSKFSTIMAAFREFHGLGSFTFKQIDQFIFIQGEQPCTTVTEARSPSAGAFDYYPPEEVLIGSK